MCGIAGFAGRGDRLAIERMTRALAHRGPDGEGFHHEADCALHLGHRRLAILDIAHGAQPMWDAEGETAITFNGEIYNHRELRAELEAAGHRFLTSHSDTEVLLQGYRAWGQDMPLRLNGMFAFCIFDRRRRRLFLARDRFGEKPLYYTHRSGFFAFASELSALALHPAVDRSIDGASLQKYFAYGYIPAPSSLYRGCRKLPGGWLLSYDLDKGELDARAYWSFRLHPDSALENQADDVLAEELRALLTDATRRRLMADVPLGLFLSGGIDSSAILDRAVSLLPADRIRTFSIGFRDPSYDESSYARLASAHYGTLHDEEILDLGRASALVREVLSRVDEPLADASILPTYLLSRFTRRQVTVALSGDGGDELFAGYDPFLSLAPAALYERLVPRSLHRFARWLSGLLPISRRNMSLDFKLRRALMGLSYPRAIWNPVWLSPVEPNAMPGLFDRPLRFEDLYSEALTLWEDGQRAGLGLVERSLEFYTRLYLQDNILTKVDRATMMCSLESRAVFLDNDLVDFVMRLPTRFKLHGRGRKVLLKKALAGRLPSAILARPKKGFGIPLSDWLRNGLDAPAVSMPGEVKNGFMEERLRAHRIGREDHRLFLWAWLAFAHRCPAGNSVLAGA